MTAQLKSLTPELSAVHRFGALLRRWRIGAGYSQPELAAKLYTSKSTLSRAETGVRPLPRDLAERCDELLGARGALKAAWHRADSSRTNRARGGQVRRGSAMGHYVGSLCSFALRSRHAETTVPGSKSAAPMSSHLTSDPVVERADLVGRRDRGRAIVFGKWEPGRYSLPLVGDVLPDPPPAGPRPRVSARVRPGTRALAYLRAAAWPYGPAPRSTTPRRSRDGRPIMSNFVWSVAWRDQRLDAACTDMQAGLLLRHSGGDTRWCVVQMSTAAMPSSLPTLRRAHDVVLAFRGDAVRWV
ncbi:helix-turn-helix domain-containing protein [Actinospica robiniae]|uniref:helix-turn-helix domain-containing protein n=1 Tax=Actinospica robiniae TaxID=304901 RepID=UPI000A03D181